MIQPAGLHRSASIGIIPCAIHLIPADFHSTIARVQVIPGSSQVDPSGCHRSASRQIIPGSSAIQPTGLHRSASIGIIPYTFDLIPAGFHSPVFTHVIPASANIDPAGRQRSVSIYPVPGSVHQIPSCSAQHCTASITVEQLSGGILIESGEHSSVCRIQIIPLAIDYSPAGCHPAVFDPVPGTIHLLPVISQLSCCSCLYIKIIGNTVYCLESVLWYSVCIQKIRFSIYSCLHTGFRSISASVSLQEVPSSVDLLPVHFRSVSGSIVFQHIPTIFNLVPTCILNSCHTFAGFHPYIFNLHPACFRSIDGSILFQIIPVFFRLLPSCFFSGVCRFSI